MLMDENECNMTIPNEIIDKSFNQRLISCKFELIGIKRTRERTPPSLHNLTLTWTIHIYVYYMYFNDIIDDDILYCIVKPISMPHQLISVSQCLYIVYRNTHTQRDTYSMHIWIVWNTKERHLLTLWQNETREAKQTKKLWKKRKNDNIVVV